MFGKFDLYYSIKRLNKDVLNLKNEVAKYKSESKATTENLSYLLRDYICDSENLVCPICGSKPDLTMSYARSYELPHFEDHEVSYDLRHSPQYFYIECPKHCVKVGANNLKEVIEKFKAVEYKGGDE